MGLNAAEEARARAFRAALAQGQLNLFARAKRLAGSAQAAQRVRTSWRPIFDWQRERTDRNG